MSEQFERKVIFRPAYDKRNPDPKKNYGIHGVEILFLLKGKTGAVQFLLYTNWQLPHVTQEFERKDRHLDPMPADLGYHSPVPHYHGQDVMSNSCEWLDGQPCYYDGSGLAAERVYQRLLEEGDAGVWDALERYYEQVFEKVTP